MARIKYYNPETGKWEYADSSFGVGSNGSGGNVDLTGVVRSVNGQTPDENGAIEFMAQGVNHIPSSVPAKGDNTTDDSVAIQALLDTRDYVYLPKGTYYIVNNPLKMTRDNCTFICDGTMIVNTTCAMEISASHCTIKVAHIKPKYNGTWNETDKWKFNASAVKLHAVTKSVMYNNIEVEFIERCINGFWFVPDGNGLGIAHNTITFRDVYAERGIYFNPGEQEYVFINGNHFYGGQLRGNNPIYTQKGANQSDHFNGNVFYHVAMEGCQKPMTLNFFSYNRFKDFRMAELENSSIQYPDPMIVFDDYSFCNEIEFHEYVNIDRVIDPVKAVTYGWAKQAGNLYAAHRIITKELQISQVLGYTARSSYGNFIVENERNERMVAHNTNIDMSADNYAVNGIICHVTATAANVNIKLSKGYGVQGATTLYVYIAERTDPYTVQVVQFDEATQAEVVIAPSSVFTETGLYKLECLKSVGWIATKVDIINILPPEQIPSITPPVAPSTMKSMANWYDETAAGATMNTITSIAFTNSYSVSGNEDASWAVDADGTGTIMAYRNGTNVIIATTNGASKIKLNADSRRMLQANGGNYAGDGRFTALSEITGTEMFVADVGTKIDNICSGNTVLTTPICIPDGVTSMKSAFNTCTALQEAPTLPDGVTDLASAFIKCSAMQTLPNIPESVEVLDYAFQECTKASGVVEVNAQNLTGYANAFYRAAMGDGCQITLTGSCPLLAELAATKGAGNVVVGS